MTEFTGAKSPYMYKVNVINKNFNFVTIRPFDIIRRIFSKYIAGNGFKCYSKHYYITRGERHLNKSQEKATDRWKRLSVRVIFKSPHYAGILQQ